MPCMDTGMLSKQIMMKKLLLLVNVLRKLDSLIKPLIFYLLLLVMVLLQMLHVKVIIRPRLMAARILLIGVMLLENVVSLNKIDAIDIKLSVSGMISVNLVEELVIVILVGEKLHLLIRCLKSIRKSILNSVLIVV